VFGNATDLVCSSPADRDPEISASDPTSAPNSPCCSTDTSRPCFPWPTPGLSHLAFKPPLDQVLVADCFALALLVGERRFRRAWPVEPHLRIDRRIEDGGAPLHHVHALQA